LNKIRGIRRACMKPRVNVVIITVISHKRQSTQRDIVSRRKFQIDCLFNPLPQVSGFCAVSAMWRRNFLFYDSHDVAAFSVAFAVQSIFLCLTLAWVFDHDLSSCLLVTIRVFNLELLTDCSAPSADEVYYFTGTQILGFFECMVKVLMDIDFTW